MAWQAELFKHEQVNKAAIFRENNKLTTISNKLEMEHEVLEVWDTCKTISNTQSPDCLSEHSHAL